MTKLNLATLAPDKREQIDRILHPRVKSLSLKFSEVDVASWHETAHALGETTTEWVERHLRAAVKREK